MYIKKPKIPLSTTDTIHYVGWDIVGIVTAPTLELLDGEAEKIGAQAVVGIRSDRGMWYGTGLKPAVDNN